MPARTSSPTRLTSPSMAAILVAVGALASGALSACGGGGGSSGGDPSGTGTGTGSGGSGSGGSGTGAGVGGSGAAPAGCTQDSECAPGLVCDTATGQCVGCVGDSQCAPGTVCSGDGQCVPGCSASQPCAGATETCCNGVCADLTSDNANCGACGNACGAAANADIACQQGVCVLTGCAPGYADCNTQSVDGCEQDLAQAQCTCVPGTTQSCYTGPPGTEGVGSCMAGTSTCLPSGLGWGICVGQIFPIFDACADGLDNDCEGTVDNPPDLDGDGWTKCQGDCCDEQSDGCTDPEVVNPGAVDVPATMVDEDCDGTVDNAPMPCDANLAVDDTNAMHGAWAMELCKQSSGAQDWGVVSAAYVRANGAALAGTSQQYGIQSNFGPNVMTQGGTRMVAISSGRARIPGQTGSCGSLTCTGTGAGAAPAGFPQDVPSCPGATNINDDIGLQVTLRAPTNATGYQFNFKFYSFEYPEWVCTSFNDQFIALVSPPPIGSINGNISFDSMNNPVSVNVAFFDVCAGCPLGTSQLVGTGFDTWNDAGGTGWLVTTAPIGGGEQFTIRFATWDTGDSAYDSTTLLDNFRWIADGTTVVVGTGPE